MEYVIVIIWIRKYKVQIYFFYNPKNIKIIHGDRK